MKASMMDEAMMKAIKNKRAKMGDPGLIVVIGGGPGVGEDEKEAGMMNDGESPVVKGKSLAKDVGSNEMAGDDELPPEIMAMLEKESMKKKMM